MRRALLALLLLLLLVPAARAQEIWRRPPAEVLAMMDAPELPSVWLSPGRDLVVLASSDRFLPMADLARPMLRLAGVRIDPATNAPHAESCVRTLTLRTIASGDERPIALPDGACVSRFRWSADGRRYAFANRVSDGLELWVSAVHGAPKRVKNVRLNGMFSDELAWMPDQRSLLVRMLPAGRGTPPVAPDSPTGPYAQESSGGGAVSTYEARDLLTTPHAEAQLAWFGRAQIALVDADSRRVRALGEPGLYSAVSASPDGQHLLVDRIRSPFSYRVAWGRFAHDLEIWDRAGRLERVFASLPVADAVPIDGVPEGPRWVSWRQTAPATLIWVEALDGGDLDRQFPHRDRLMTQDASFQAAPREIWRAQHRVDDWWWGARDGELWVSEWDRQRRWKTTWRIGVDGGAPRKVFDRSARDRYGDPGNPVMRRGTDGAVVMWQQGDDVYFAGAGASPQGERPFLDRYSLATGATERLFRSELGLYERFIDWIDPAAGTFLTQRESPVEVPNYQLRTLVATLSSVSTGEATRSSTHTALTRFDDPAPQLRQIQKRIVSYTRADGVPLSFTLYLPPGYQEGTRLPTVLMAYPFEYSDPATAGQISGSEYTFSRFHGATPLYLLLSGYAVLSNTSVPVIGDPETAYDSFVEQVVASAAAAVDKAVELGVTDRARVGVWGHSHGALMVATLLAHSDLFRAGIARSGAYNHTIRPFGFQNEHRTLWEARDTYLHLSPVLHAPKIDEPLLLIHGALDPNPGTVPLQSEKLFDAVRGVGGTARLVILPHELHGYVSREANEQVLAEQLDWMDRWVKEAPPRAELSP